MMNLSITQVILLILFYPVLSMANGPVPMLPPPPLPALSSAQVQSSSNKQSEKKQSTETKSESTDQKTQTQSGCSQQTQAKVEVKIQCLIHVVSNHPICVGAQGNMYYKVNVSFVDTDGYANMNAGRCLERALEYANWCGDGNAMKTTGAAAYFMVDGKAVINSYAHTASQKTAIGDGVGRTLRFRD